MTAPREYAALLGSSAMASAYAVTTIGALFAGHVLVQLIGDAGYSAVIVGLCALGMAIMLVRRREISLVRLAPTTLVVLLGWLLATVAWSYAPGPSLVGWLVLTGSALLAIVVAHTRDTLQTVRATGDVLRVMLVGSLLVEVLSGILLDTPFEFLGVAGNLAEGGPIQGLFGTRTTLGLVTVLAIITFLVEWRTRSVRPGLTVFSVTLATVLALFTGSPIVLVLAFVSGVATAVLAVVRRTPPHARFRLQIGIALVVAVTVVLVVVYRRAVVSSLNAAPDFYTRSQLWKAVIAMVRDQPVQGWGWFGAWDGRFLPFVEIDFVMGKANGSALNAFIDVLLQAGWVGAFLFAVLCVLALSRAWLTASQRRSTVYTWSALVLIALLVDSIVESSVLTGFGWFLLVVCATRSSLVRGWRAGMDDRPAASPALPHEPDPR